MANYNVDIAVAVKGQKQLKNVGQEVKKLSKGVKELNKIAKKQVKAIPTEFEKLNKKLNRTNKVLKQIRREARRTTSELKNLSKVPSFEPISSMKLLSDGL